MQTANRAWFPAKRYGWGWGLPLVWQGWLVYGISGVALCLILRWVPPTQHPIRFVGWMVAWVAALISVCLLKGERPQWRWGR
jgi:hypothetical protein